MLSKNFNPFLKKILENTNPLKTEEVKFALCVSGGVDSMALFHSFFDFLRQANLKNVELHITHINHGISSNANDWEKFVYEEVEKKKNRFSGILYRSNIDIIFKSFSLNLTEQYAKEQVSELLCREKRYELINQYCFDNQIQYVFTAHHKNDVYENNFISIFKNRMYSFFMKENNTNTIQNEFDLYYCKPFLSLNKKELEKYLLDNDYAHIEDESNEISDNLRNVLRNELFASLNKLKNPQIYLNAMENFFQHFNFTQSFYTNIIQQKILNQVGLISYGKYVDGKIKNSEVFSLSMKEIMPYLCLNKQMNCFESFKDKTKPYIYSSKEDFVFNKEINFELNEIDLKFLIEIINLFYHSKFGIYLTGKNKKFLASNLERFIQKETKLQIFKKEDVFFGIKFNHIPFYSNENQKYFVAEQEFKDVEEVASFEKSTSELNKENPFVNLTKSYITFYLNEEDFVNY